MFNNQYYAKKYKNVTQLNLLCRLAFFSFLHSNSANLLEVQKNLSKCQKSNPTSFFLRCSSIDVMLSRAHWLHRQAEKATRKGNVEEAVKYHKEAAEILNTLMQDILDEKVAESLRLQAQLHEKESQRSLLLHSQRRRAEKVYRNLESLRRMASAKSNNNAGDRDSLQLSIYRKFEETESLLDQLKIQDDYDSSSSIVGLSERSFDATTVVESENNLRHHHHHHRNIVVGEASKKPKDAEQIIEELQVANSHLRKMVESLFKNEQNLQKENAELRQKVRYLESTAAAAASHHNSSTIPIRPTHSAQPSPKHNLNPGLRTFRPFPDDADSMSLPPTTSAVANTEEALHLPPLEMPSFDFES